jgi:hypothetical protein
MDSWGCEFLELENYKIPYKKFTTLPINIVSKMVSSNRKAEILAREKEYIADLTQNIKQNGLHTPLEITIAPNGCSLTEGNHRFICLEILQKEEIPVIIKKQEQNIKQGGINTYELIIYLLQKFYKLEEQI